MDLAVRRVLVLACATGGLAAVSLALPSPWDQLAVLPWALVLGGPVALWILHPALLGDDRAWARAIAYALPGLAVAGATRESIRALARSLAPDMVERQLASVVLHVVWLAATLAMAGLAARRAMGRERQATLGFALAAILAATVVDVTGALVLAEAAGILAVSRFERAPSTYARAVVAAGIVLGVGLVAFWIAAGPSWPPQLALDDTPFGLGIMPLLAAAGLAFSTMLFVGEPVARSSSG